MIPRIQRPERITTAAARLQEIHCNFGLRRHWYEYKYKTLYSRRLPLLREFE